MFFIFKMSFSQLKIPIFKTQLDSVNFLKKFHKCKHFEKQCDKRQEKKITLHWSSGPAVLNTYQLLGNVFRPGLNLFTVTITLTNQYTLIGGVHPNIIHFKHILEHTFLKIPITHTQSMFLLCKLFSMAIHSMAALFPSCYETLYR